MELYFNMTDTSNITRNRIYFELENEFIYWELINQYYHYYHIVISTKTFLKNKATRFIIK